jgi:hypothetical protein
MRQKIIPKLCLHTDKKGHAVNHKNGKHASLLLNMNIYHSITKYSFASLHSDYRLDKILILSHRMSRFLTAPYTEQTSVPQNSPTKPPNTKPSPIKIFS